MDYSLYFHIPFCKKKCDYCHFFVIPNHERFYTPFMEALEKQWHQRLHRLPTSSLRSIYFGGGTPSCLPPSCYEKILSWINPDPSVEITLEGNPDGLTPSLLDGYKQVGINRLSLGIQSLNDELLRKLSRTHDSRGAVDTVESAHRIGFDNISIDLMYDLPDQTLDMWIQTCQSALKLPIAHLSLYNLTIEPHTAFYKRRAQLCLPSDETSTQMLLQATHLFEEAGLKRYEISAFGRPSIHNTGYWTDRPFLGYGPSAFSDWDKSRFQNIANFWKFVRMIEEGKDPIDYQEKLPALEREKERVAVGLRMLQGVETSLDLNPLIEKGLVTKQGLLYCLTAQGLLYYDEVASEII
jgi:oxygen-independent coproporphyrinogen-3 oxidase